MDLHGHKDDAEELEEYLKEIQMVREQIPVSYNSTRVSSPPPHHPSESRVPIDSLLVAPAFENLSFGQSHGRGSSSNRSELASMGVERQPYFSPRPSIAGITDQLLATSSSTPHVANQEHNSQSTYVAPDLYTVVPLVVLSPCVNNIDQYSNLQGDFVTNNLAFPGPIIAAERTAQPGILSPFVNSTDQYSSLQRGLEINNLAFPAPILAQRIVQPGIRFPPFDLNSMDQYSNLGGNLGYGGLMLAAETTVQPGSLSPYLRDNIVLARALQSQVDHIQGHLRDPLLRGRHQRAHQRASVNPQNPTEHQLHETSFRASGQAHDEY